MKINSLNTPFFPHKRHPMGFYMPVALVKDGSGLARDKSDNPIAETTADGKIVYVLPGGGRWVE